MTIALATRRYSLSEYLMLEAKSEQRHEFVNGFLLPMPGGTGRHNLISANVIAAFKVAFKSVETRYLVLTGDQKIHIPQKNHVRYADALVVCEQMEFHDEGGMLLTNPLLIAEVLSPSTAEFDRGPKFHEYQTIPSLKEYVLIEQEMPLVQSFYREEPDLWRISQQDDPKGVLKLRSLGIEIALADVYEFVKFDEEQKDA